MFEKIRNEFNVPNFLSISIPQDAFSSSQIFNEWCHRSVSMIDVDNSFDSNLLFIHPCPHDESAFSDLSFAGCYKSYKPYSWKSKRDNIFDGLEYVYKNRNNRISNYYYKSHGISSDKSFDIIISQLVEANVYGTAYIFDDVVICSYYSSFLSVYHHDPYCFINDLNSTNKNLKSIDYMISETLIEIKRRLDCAIDVEFLIDNNGTFIVNEVRPISYAHLRNKAKINKYSDFVERNVFNSAFECEGKVVDLRKRKPTIEDLYNHDCNNVYIVEHLGVEFNSLDFLEWCTNNNLSDVITIFDHSKNRDNDHLQYIAFEEERLSKISNVFLNEQNVIGQKVKILSDGFITSII